MWARFAASYVEGQLKANMSRTVMDAPADYSAGPFGSEWLMVTTDRLGRWQVGVVKGSQRSVMDDDEAEVCSDSLGLRPAHLLFFLSLASCRTPTGTSVGTFAP